MINTIFHKSFVINDSDFIFNYQNSLTPRLDSIEEDFNQNIINEIVLWKLNRYALIPESTIMLINKLSKSDTLNEALTREILFSLLQTKGIQLPMASTILRFKNPEVYQIIDQRVYRILYGKILSLHVFPSESNTHKNIDSYIDYLAKLRTCCTALKIPFSQSDRILYEADKRINKDVKLKNYG